MGVSHLRQHSNAAAAKQINNGPVDAKQIGTPLTTRFKANSPDYDYHKVAEVHAYSERALKPGMAPAQPDKMGGRMGTKTTTPKLGKTPTNAYPKSGGMLN